jgi:hypothetical protein
MLHFKLLEKQEEAKPTTNRRREIIKIKAKINKQTPIKRKNTKNQQNKKLVL